MGGPASYHFCLSFPAAPRPDSARQASGGAWRGRLWCERLCFAGRPGARSSYSNKGSADTQTRSPRNRLGATPAAPLRASSCSSDAPGLSGRPASCAAEWRLPLHASRHRRRRRRRHRALVRPLRLQMWRAIYSVRGPELGTGGPRAPMTPSRLRRPGGSRAAAVVAARPGPGAID